MRQERRREKEPLQRGITWPRRKCGTFTRVSRVTAKGSRLIDATSFLHIFDLNSDPARSRSYKIERAGWKVTNKLEPRNRVPLWRITFRYDEPGRSNDSNKNRNENKNEAVQSRRVCVSSLVIIKIASNVCTCVRRWPKFEIVSDRYIYRNVARTRDYIYSRTEIKQGGITQISHLR